ncbi:peptidase T [Leuconostocaceae bacterium ESL0958]|nr:peptidase T [Leuconostocaceae bacterium ESL0958]
MTKTYDGLIDRFWRYVQMDTQSDEQSSSTPSTAKQQDFLDALAAELATVGLTNIRQMPDGYLFADLAATVADKTVPKIGLIAHVDTADFNGHGVAPQLVKNYDGQSTIPLGDSGYVLDPATFPSLKKYAGHDLITTDGQTLLGADDKAGVAELVTLAAYLIDHPEIKHGPVRFAFGPDEEIGRGADHFQVADFDADFAYTVDGGPLGELEWETFNAAAATVTIQGQNVHPGTAKGTMVNALQVGIDFHNALPADQRPEVTTDRAGFFHLIAMTGTADQASLHYIIRDHDRTLFEEKKARMASIADQLNADLDQDRIELAVQDQYYNMGDRLKDHQEVVALAKRAMVAAGIEPVIEPVRGGTDGSKITFLGLPTPNLFAGGENMHGRFEYVSKQVMEQAVTVLIGILTTAASDRAVDQ